MQKHWIWLAQRNGIGHVGCKKLLSALHSAEDIYEMNAEQYRTLGLKFMRSNWIETLSDKDLAVAERIVEECRRHEIQIITYNDPMYPQRLKEIYDPPCVLYCKGTLPDMDREAVVGVVGTRRCTNYGLILTRQLSSLIGLSGGVVVSGGARGVDTMALYGALMSYKPVVCVLAGGLDEYYPRENKKLFEDITRQGCLISELPPGNKPVPQYFVGRNRLISGLSVAVLVVEAPKGSGAMTTAELALSQNRDVFTVLRGDNTYYNQGNRELIDAGCEVVRDGWELMSRYAPLFPDKIIDGRGREALQLQYQKQFGRSWTLNSSHSAYSDRTENKMAQYSVLKDPAPVTSFTSEERVQMRKNASSGGTSRPQDLPESESKVLSVIGADPIEIDEIILKTGMEATAVSTALTMLQIKKRITKCFGNSYQRI